MYVMSMFGAFFWYYHLQVLNAIKDTLPDVVLVIFAVAGLAYLFPEFLRWLEHSRTARIILAAVCIVLGAAAVIVNHLGRQDQESKQEERDRRQTEQDKKIDA